MNGMKTTSVPARRLTKALVFALSLLLGALLLSAAAQETNGVLSFLDLDPTPPELFEDCLGYAPDAYGVLECATNVELVNVAEFEACMDTGSCGRFAYSVPVFPEKLGHMVSSTYDELWVRHLDDIYDHAYDAWKNRACAIAAYPEVAADVTLYGLGDASLRYWSEVFVASSYYLPASLWWQTPFPSVLDFSGDSSDRIITPISSLIPKPDGYLALGEKANQSLDLNGQDRGIYYFQPPAFPSSTVPFEAGELAANLPGIPSFETLKKELEPASALEYSQFGHASFFEVYGKRRVVDIFVVWVKECVPSPQTSPLAVFIVPLLPKVETRGTTTAEGYPLSKVGAQSWFPDPMSAYQPNSLEDAADRMMLNPLYDRDPASFSPLDPKGSLLGAFIRTRIPLATDFNIPQEVIDDAKGGGEDGSGGVLSFLSGGGTSVGGPGGGATGEEARASLADVLNCPPVTVGPGGALPYPILAVGDQTIFRPLGHYNQSLQYLFRYSADPLYSDETRAKLDEFVGYFELPESTDPASWKTSSSGYKRDDANSSGRPAGGSVMKLSFGGPGSNGVLCVGDEGSEVATLDRLLARAGYGSGGGAAAPGVGLGLGGGGNEFTEDTKQNLIDFQTDMGLTPDGMTGPETWAALHATAANREDPPGYQLATQGVGPGGAWPGGFQGGGGAGGQDGGQPDGGGSGGEGSGPPDLSTLHARAPEPFSQATRGPLLAQEGGQGAGEQGEQEGEPGGDQAQGEAPPDAAEFALEILENPDIVLWDGSPRAALDSEGNPVLDENGNAVELVLTDGSDPLSNLTAAAEGVPSKRSAFNGVPSGDTWLSPYMLEGLLEIAEYHQVEVIAVAGGVHPAGSPHYEGAAFAISAVNDRRVAEMPVEIGFSGEPVATVQGGVLPESEGGQGVVDSSSDETSNTTTSNMLSGGMLGLPETINGESLDEIFKPNEGGGLLETLTGALDAVVPLPLDLGLMSSDDLMSAEDISDSFDRDSPNTLLQVVVLCELAFATDILSPLNDSAQDNVQCTWPTAEEVASGEAEEPGEGY